MHYCSVNCSEETISGGVCGDGTIQGPPGGPEVCEGTGPGSGMSGVSDSQCLSGCTAACPPDYTAFALSFRTDPIPGFCSPAPRPPGAPISCSRDSGEGGCPGAADYCDTGRFRSQASSVILSSGQFVGFDVPACRALSQVDLIIISHPDGDGAISNIRLTVGMGGRLVTPAQTVAASGLIQLTLPPRADGSPFICEDSAQLVHLGVSFAGTGTVELRAPSVQACRP